MTITYLKKSPKTSSTDDNKTTEIVKNLLKEIENSKEEIKDNLVLGNATSLPWQDNFFDLVLSIVCLRVIRIRFRYRAR